MKKIVFILGVLLLFSSMLHAQSKEIKKGNKYFQKKNYSMALNYYKQALGKETIQESSILQNIANTYFYQDIFGEAKEIFDQLSRDEMTAESLLSYGVVCMHYGNYSKAINMLENAKKQGSTDPLLNTYKQSCTWAQANNSPVGYSVSKSDVVIDGISFGLQFYDDGIVYSLLDPTAKEKDPKGFPYTNINFVTYDNGVTGAPSILAESLKMPGHEGAITFDGTQEVAYFTAVTYSKKGRNMKIFETKKQGDSWSKPKALPFNSKKYSCAYPTVNEEGSIMYFSSDMPGGTGGMDIFYVEKSGEKWGNPIYCGSEINTKGDEIYPFLTTDGDLYFSSNGKMGFGGQDVFFAMGSHANWSEITNLKKPINSSRNDYAYVINPYNTEHAFISSNREGDGSTTSIFSVKAVTLEPEPSIDDFLSEAGESGSIDDFLGSSDKEGGDNDAASDDIDDLDTYLSGASEGASENETGTNGNDGNVSAETSDEGDSGNMTLEQHLQEMMGKDAIIYRVQFMSSTKSLDKVKLDETGDLVYRYFYQGLYRYTVGEYYEVEPAIELKERLQEFGYKDAFIAAFRNNERVLDVQIYKR